MAIAHKEKMRQVEHAQRLESAGNHAAGIKIYRELIRQEPTDASLHYLLAVAHLAIVELPECLRSIRQAIRYKPTQPEFYAVQAIALRASHRLDEALESARRGLELDPKNIVVLETLGDLLYVRGELEAGIDLMMPAYEAGCDNPQFLASLARLLLSAKRKDEAKTVLERAIRNTRVKGQLVAWPHMQLGQMLEKEGDHERAWKHYEIANRNRGVMFNPELHESSVRAIIAGWSAERMARLPRARNRKSSQLVFILGMPRSGTSLVEQIIASHPDAYGGGELNFVAMAARELLLPTLEQPSLVERLENLRQSVIDRESQKVQKQMTAPASRAKRFTDKLPQNFMHIGMIELLFPEATIIHTKRDPRDICISCHTRLFGGGANQPYAADLDHLGRYYNAYERIMEHWKEVSSLPILEVQYEELVADLEGHARKLIDHIGLPWDDACLRFHETKRDVVTESTDQVRQPIYTSSIGRWKRFERQLAPLSEALGLAGSESSGG